MKFLKLSPGQSKSTMSDDWLDFETGTRVKIYFKSDADGKPVGDSHGEVTFRGTDIVHFGPDEVPTLRTLIAGYPIVTPPAQAEPASLHDPRKGKK